MIVFRHLVLSYIAPIPPNTLPATHSSMTRNPAISADNQGFSLLFVGHAREGGKATAIDPRPDRRRLDRGAAGLAAAEPPPENPWPPIVFYVAKGEPDACGAGCREWIAAEGTIDQDAPTRLRSLLNRLGQRKLPIYFHSPGGSVEGGLAIGRLMRERRMTAGVGRTIPLGCDPLQEHEAACDSLKRAGRELMAELRTARTLCNSSCVYALIGAAVREVGAGARIGVHEIALGRDDGRGMPAPVDRKSLSQEQLKQLRAEEARLARYIGEMGIDKALFEAAAQIRHERVRYLSLDEIARFGIDRREFQESRWMVDEGPTGTAGGHQVRGRGQSKRQRKRQAKLTREASRSSFGPP